MECLFRQDERTDTEEWKDGGRKLFFWAYAVCHRAVFDFRVFAAGVLDAGKVYVI